MANELLSSREAARRLGVSAATLYAYVAAACAPEAVDGRRERRYRADDIARLKRRRDVGRKAEPIANHALDFGTPVLESSLTLIENNRLYYRGRDAAELARSASLEEVARPVGLRRAAVRGRQPAADDHGAAPRLAGRGDPGTGRSLPRRPAGRGRARSSELGEDRGAMLETGVRVLRLLTAAVTARPLSALPVHQELAAAWKVPAERAPLLRAALVLSADHEFNASAFARVVASTGANLYGATMAGLAALNGPRHGGLTRRVASLFDDLKKARDLDGELVQRVRDRIYIPGFGHQLYPDGDVRAATLFALLREAVPTRPSSPSPSGWPLRRTPDRPQAQRRLHHRRGRTRARPSQGLRAGAVPAGPHRGVDRPCIGAVRHAALIRPRARYTGPRPQG